MCRHTVIATSRNDGDLMVGWNGPDIFDRGVFEGERPKKGVEP